MMMPPFERELLQRYIDLPFNRLSGAICTGSSASGFVTNDPTAHGTASGKAGRGGGEGVPGFSAVDEDESESGLFAVKDFRNMSFKVCVRVNLSITKWFSRLRKSSVGSQASIFFFF